MNLTQIKDDYLTGAITLKEAKERLFEYSPHPVAAESNNEILKAWTHIKRSRKLKENKLSTEALVPIETNRICAETFNKLRVYYQDRYRSFSPCRTCYEFYNMKIEDFNWFLLMQVNEVKDFLNL